MNGRHKRLLGILLSLFTFSFACGLYLFVLIHEHHIWSIGVISLLLFFMIITPACCYGYDVNTDVNFLLKDGITDEQTFLNCRDIGYGVSITLFSLTYAMATVAWYASSGKNPTWIGTILLYMANTFIAFAFGGFVKIKIFS
jgi:hypothetical protein